MIVNEHMVSAHRLAQHLARRDAYGVRPWLALLRRDSASHCASAEVERVLKVHWGTLPERVKK